MKILITKPLQDEIKRSRIRNPVPLQEIASLLEKLSVKDLEKNPRIRRVPDTSEEIYVMRYGDLRIFLTKKDNDIVLLSITNG